MCYIENWIKAEETTPVIVITYSDRELIKNSDTQIHHKRNKIDKLLDHILTTYKMLILCKQGFV